MCYVLVLRFVNGLQSSQRGMQDSLRASWSTSYRIVLQCFTNHAPTGSVTTVVILMPCIYSVTEKATRFLIQTTMVEQAKMIKPGDIAAI
jgi:hypothetical protein